MHFTRALIGAFFFVLVVVYVGLTFLFLRSSRRKPGNGRVLVVRSPWGTRVSRRTTLVLPFVHSVVEFDTGDRRVEVDLTDPPLTWADGAMHACRAVGYVGVPDDDARILELERGIGVVRGSDDGLLSALWREAFARILREVASELLRPSSGAGEALQAGFQARVERIIAPFEVRRLVLTSPGAASASRSMAGDFQETSP